MHHLVISSNSAMWIQITKNDKNEEIVITIIVMNSAYSTENTISIVNIHTLLLGFKKDDTDDGFSEQLI